ncbi:MAG: hypothetical protein HFE98_07575 [Ruminiclostridium sp.]|nr:hypothetical protein [Ruminiclostridium sp.]
MAVCSFLGHREVYDINIDVRIQLAVNRIVEKNERVEFLLYPCGNFYDWCLLAALRARSHNPEKVTITLVLQEEEYKPYLKQERINIPPCMIDKIVTPHIDIGKSKDVSMPYKKMNRWLIQNSTHLISYVYKSFHDQVSPLLDFAPSKPLEVIDITSTETIQASLECVSSLSGKELYVLEKMSEGHSIKEISEKMALTLNRIGQIARHGGAEIRKKMQIRYQRDIYLGKETQTFSCSIFSMGEGTYQSLNVFEHILDFLIRAYDIKNFHVERTCVPSTFMYVLTKKTGRIYQARITAVTVTEDEDISDSCCPPCDAVAYVDPLSCPNHLGELADMISRSDFCICDLSTSTCSNAIKDYASQTGHTALLDMSKSYPKDRLTTLST